MRVLGAIVLPPPASLMQVRDTLPPQLAGLPDIVDTAARSVREAKTKKQAVQAVKAAIGAVQRTSVRKVREGKTTYDFFAFLMTEPNAIVAPIHPKAMPVIVNRPVEVEKWLSPPAPQGEGAATTFAQRYVLRIVARTDPIVIGVTPPSPLGDGGMWRVSAIFAAIVGFAVCIYARYPRPPGPPTRFRHRCIRRAKRGHNWIVRADLSHNGIAAR
jgi:hypothetical protein